MIQRNINNAGMFLFLEALIVMGRYFPHATNFTPAAAAGLFAGFWFRNRLVAAAVPLTGMLLSDLLIQQYYPWATMAIVYAAMTLPALFGPMLRRRSQGMAAKVGKVTLGAVSASVLFFLSTNLAVWLFDGIYAHNWAGLTACYAAAVPFFRFTLGGDLMFSILLFGGYALITRFATRKQAQPAGL